MSEEVVNTTRSRTGTAADRKPDSPVKQIGGMATTSGVVGLLVGTADYLIKVKEANEWLSPDNALVVLWATALAPLFLLVYKIVENRLKKAAGETT